MSSLWLTPSELFNVLTSACCEPGPDGNNYAHENCDFELPGGRDIESRIDAILSCYESLAGSPLDKLFKEFPEIKRMYAARTGQEVRLTAMVKLAEDRSTTTLSVLAPIRGDDEQPIYSSISILPEPKEKDDDDSDEGEGDDEYDDDHGDIDGQAVLAGIKEDLKLIELGFNPFAADAEKKRKQFKKKKEAKEVKLDKIQVRELQIRYLLRVVARMLSWNPVWVEFTNYVSMDLEVDRKAALNAFQTTRKAEIKESKEFKELEMTDKDMEPMIQQELYYQVTFDNNKAPLAFSERNTAWVAFKAELDASEEETLRLEAKATKTNAVRAVKRCKEAARVYEQFKKKRAAETPEAEGAPPAKKARTEEKKKTS